jgi:hypothetical protein
MDGRSGKKSNTRLNGDSGVAEEEWRPVPHFPNYEISESGRVRREGRLLKPSKQSVGYIRYGLWQDGRRKEVLAHRLVCEAWHGPLDAMRPVVAHWDNDKTNNHYSNLRWCTQKENQQDRVRHGTTCEGERNGNSILNDELVRSIRGDFSGIHGQIRSIAKRYKVSEGTVRQIINQITWRHVN